MIDIDASAAEFKGLSNTESRDARIIFPHHSIYQQVRAVLEKRLIGEIEDLKEFFRRELGHKAELTDVLEGWCDEFNEAVTTMEAPFGKYDTDVNLRFIPKQIWPDKLVGRACLMNGWPHSKKAALSEKQELFMLAREVKKLEGWKKLVIKKLEGRAERLKNETGALTENIEKTKQELGQFPKDEKERKKLPALQQNQYIMLTRKQTSLARELQEKTRSFARCKRALKDLSNISMIAEAEKIAKETELAKAKTAFAALDEYANKLRGLIRASGNPLPQSESIRDLYSVDAKINNEAPAPKRIDSRLPTGRQAWRGNDIKKRPKMRLRIMLAAVAGLFMKPEGILRPCLPAGRQALDDTSIAQDDNSLTDAAKNSPSANGEAGDPKAKDKLKLKIAQLQWEIERHIVLNPPTIWCDFVTDQNGREGIYPWMMPHISIMTIPEFATNQLQITVYGEPREGETSNENTKRTKFASFPEEDPVVFPMEKWEGFFALRKPLVKVEFTDPYGGVHVILEKAVNVNFVYPSPLAQDHIRRVFEKEGLPALPDVDNIPAFP